MLAGVVLLIGSPMVFSEPGSETDPLVSLSYVEDKVKEIYNYIDTKIANSNQGSNNSHQWEVVEIKEGDYLIGKSGTEIILRGGKATAHGVKVDQGLTDITEGRDVDNTKDLLIPNHLLIVPRDDGRGVFGVSDAIFMVKGEYEVK